MNNIQMTESGTEVSTPTDEASTSGRAAPEVAMKPNARGRKATQKTDAPSAGPKRAKLVRATSAARTQARIAPALVADLTGKPKVGGKVSKTDAVLKLLRTAKGASVAQIEATTSWQAHSVRGFLSGTVRKKLGLTLTSEMGKDGVRRYRIAPTGDGA